MSRSISKRMAASSALYTVHDLAGVCRRPAQSLRPFSQATRRPASESGGQSPFTFAPKRRGEQSKDESKSSRDLSKLSSFFDKMISDTRNERSGALDIRTFASQPVGSKRQLNKFVEPYHFHVNSHKHNTHITVTRPNREPIISVSCGNLGFRKSGRKHYDSAFQLASFVLNKMRQQGLHKDIPEMEVVLKGFGAGREAVTKCLLGIDGSGIKQKIVRVTDATKLKFGGTKGDNPRRLG